MEKYFETFRENIVGIDASFPTHYAENQPLIYADWTASGRCYQPIERLLSEEIAPFVANTHTETNSTGMAMTQAYHKALTTIKRHVNASSDDVILAVGSGMTGAVNKFQRLLGLKIHERFKEDVRLKEEERPIVFITHMEHHSNQTTWLETICDVEIIHPNANGLVDLAHLQTLIEKYQHRLIKIAAITSCSNVTGIFTPYHQVAEIMHQVGGLCFVDFACSAPYIEINMHPSEYPLQYLDAIYFSPHKFLGGPGTPGMLIFNKKLYQNTVPDTPGGGTVEWTNPWKSHRYIDDIEQREDGGTPAFLQTIKAALAVRLKEQMGVDNILKREKEQNKMVFSILKRIPNLHLLAPNVEHRLSIFSFYIEGLPYNLGVKMLNDRFGVQVRGGCSCAGTYGHYLLNILNEETSRSITDQIDAGDYTNKPGWIRLSLHPTTSDEEIFNILDAVKKLAENHQIWAEDYEHNRRKNAFHPKNTAPDQKMAAMVEKWFELPTVNEMEFV
jgi:selenocysteine lyase/cysteine desulfurase